MFTYFEVFYIFWSYLLAISCISTSNPFPASSSLPKQQASLLIARSIVYFQQKNDLNCFNLQKSIQKLSKFVTLIH